MHGLGETESKAFFASGRLMVMTSMWPRRSVRIRTAIVMKTARMISGCHKVSSSDPQLSHPSGTPDLQSLGYDAHEMRANDVA